MIHNSLCSWSGGKDSCFALMKAMEENSVPKVLLTVLNEEGKISRSHCIPADILGAQAKACSIPGHLISSSWSDYERNFTASLISLKEKYQLNHAVFGDIDLQAHREWEEMVCRKAGLDARLPLWQQDRLTLVHQMIDAGIDAMIVSCNGTMGDKFIGKKITRDLIDELEAIGVDPCGENGEYHTLVLNCPLFANSIDVDITERIQHENYWFAKLILNNN